MNDIITIGNNIVTHITSSMASLLASVPSSNACAILSLCEFLVTSILF